MNDYIEIVENPGQAQPWHVRIVGGNHEPEWSTETFHREETARESILRLGRMFSPVQKATVTEHELIVWIDEDEMGAKLVVPLRQTTVDDDGVRSTSRQSSHYAAGGMIQRRSGLLEAAAMAEKVHRIATTPSRDVSQEDEQWVKRGPQHTLWRIAMNRIAAPALPMIADWLRNLAGGQP